MRDRWWVRSRRMLIFCYKQKTAYERRISDWSSGVGSSDLAAGLFIGSPHGIGTDFAQSGQNGPSIFPSTSLAARVQWAPAEGWAARAAEIGRASRRARGSQYV